MKRKIINYSTSLVFTIIFLFVGILGVLIFPGFLRIFGINLNSLPKTQMYKIHHLVGVILILTLSIHIVLHWNWIVKSTKKFYTKSIKRNSKSIKQLANYVTDIVLLIVSLVLIITGIIKFPGLINYFNIELTSIPLNEISSIHDWSGIAVFCLAIVHLILFLTKIVSKKRSLN